jgi:hypothetical protein
MLAYKVSEQAFPNNTDVQECFNSHAAAEQDFEELTIIRQPNVKYSECCGETLVDYQCSEESPMDGDGLVNHLMDRCLNVSMQWR